MLKRIAFVLGAILALAPSIAAPAAAQDTLAKIKQRGAVVVGVKNDYKPWGFVDPGGQIVGMEIDLANDVATRLGVRLETVPVTAANRMEFLQQGRIDLIIATLGDTPQRRQAIGMIEPNYYAGGTNVLARKAAKLTAWPQLKGQKVCAAEGAYYNRRVAQLYGPELIVFPAVPEAFNALLGGSCVAFLFDSTLFESTLAAGDAKWADYEMPLKTEDEQPWAVAVALPDLKGPWGDFMRAVSVDWHKTGKLLALEKKWGIKQSPFLVEMNLKYK
jgi:polar amino acid transport system substrate-binding protein